MSCSLVPRPPSKIGKGLAIVILHVLSEVKLYIPYWLYLIGRAKWEVLATERAEASPDRLEQ